MSGPDSDPTTAESKAQDTDFAAEHTRPTFSDEPSTEGPDESVPSGRGGDGGMDPGKHKRRRPWKRRGTSR